MATIAELLSQELGQKQEYIENVIALMDEGNTIPFIARYRKECTVQWTIRCFARWKPG